MTLDKLLGYHDQEFIINVYRTLLGREPDPNGADYYLSHLQSGMSKLQILMQVRGSFEAASYAVDFPDLDSTINHYKRSCYPLVGWVFRRLYKFESDSPLSRRLRSIENKLGALESGGNKLKTQAAKLGIGSLNVGQLSAQAREIYAKLSASILERSKLES